jgi:hypothetical protein
LVFFIAGINLAHFLKLRVLLLLFKIGDKVDSFCWFKEFFDLKRLSFLLFGLLTIKFAKFYNFFDKLSLLMKAAPLISVLQIFGLGCELYEGVFKKSTLKRNFFWDMGLLFELLLETLDDFIDCVNFYLFELPSQVTLDDLVQLPQCLSQFRVKMILQVIVGSILEFCTSPENMRQSMPSGSRCSNAIHKAVSIPRVSTPRRNGGPGTDGIYFNQLLPISTLLGVSLKSVFLAHFLGHKSPFLDLEIVKEMDNDFILLGRKGLILGHL